jgi:hypothetical protein
VILAAADYAFFFHLRNLCHHDVICQATEIEIEIEIEIETIQDSTDGFAIQMTFRLREIT